jgi:hypothetical protein
MLIKFLQHVGPVTPYQFNPSTGEFEESEYECTFEPGEILSAELVNDETGSLPYVNLQIKDEGEVKDMIIFGSVRRTWYEVLPQRPVVEDDLIPLNPNWPMQVNP